MALKAHLRMNMHLTNRWARWTGEQGRWWLTLRGTQLMTSYDVAARQSTTGCYRQFRLPQAGKQWPDMLLRSHHSDCHRRVNNGLICCWGHINLIASWLVHHRSSVRSNATCIVYSITLCIEDLSPDCQYYATRCLINTTLLFFWMTPIKWTNCDNLCTHAQSTGIIVKWL